ncbi:GNAT family N-acetyltransferase [Niveispirillum irakense]|uniref:GNAT family N-acetyltransferase n=1 Tax=Niveispirillum irakense TaxID=34011 RepID=UPI0004020A9F|nr:N-acetyltransferase [Niveispirillum irakense]
MNITVELPAHAGAIEQLLDTSFGPKRHTKTVYRLRKNVAPVADLCFVATDTDVDGNEKLVGTIRYWPIMLGGTVPALLLGPIAIDPEHRSGGLGGKMIRHSLARAAELGHRIVILVGDAPYYVRFGFSREKTLALSLPGPVDPARFLGLELVDGALDGVTGTVGRATTRSRTSNGSSRTLPARKPAAVTQLVTTATNGGISETEMEPTALAPSPTPMVSRRRRASR